MHAPCMLGTGERANGSEPQTNFFSSLFDLNKFKKRLICFYCWFDLKIQRIKNCINFVPRKLPYYCNQVNLVIYLIRLIYRVCCGIHNNTTLIWSFAKSYFPFPLHHSPEVTIWMYNPSPKWLDPFLLGCNALRTPKHSQRELVDPWLQNGAELSLEKCGLVSEDPFLWFGWLRGSCRPCWLCHGFVEARRGGSGHSGGCCCAI